MGRAALQNPGWPFQPVTHSYPSRHSSRVVQVLMQYESSTEKTMQAASDGQVSSRQGEMVQ